MTSSSEPQRTSVLRRGAADVRPARLTADLRTSPFATARGADARLVDPVLERAVEERAERAEAQGRAQGYADGHAQGRAAASTEAAAERARANEERAACAAAQQAQLEQAVAALVDAAARLEDRLLPAAQQVESMALRIAVDLAEALVARELRATDDVVLATAARALSLAPAGAPVVLHVSPTDVAVLAALPFAGRTVDMVGDPSVPVGSCVVDAGSCTVDGRIEDALARARTVLGP